MRNAFISIGLALLPLLFNGCSIQTMAVRTTADIMSDGAGAFEEEYDLDLAEQAIAGNLKVLEALLKNDPDNKTLLVLLSKIYGGYSFAFMEDRYHQWKESKPRRAAYYKKRAGDFYLRGKEFAIRHLKNESSEFAEGLSGDVEKFGKSLSDIDEDDADALFWTAYNWGNWVNMNLNDPEAIADAPRVELMMKRLLALDENFYYGGPHLFYGAYLGSRPPTLGGNRKLAKQHFEKALSTAGRKFLITQILYAKFYAVQIQDERLFIKLLTEVVRADDRILPEQNLITQLAKRKAKRLLSQKSDLF